MSKLSSITPWYICKEGDKFTVRRTTVSTDGLKKQVRLDRDTYKHLERNREELNAFVIRLNAKENPGQATRERQTIEGAFINEALLQKFETYLREQIPSDNYVTGMMGYIRNHFIGFFMHTMKLQNPTEWHQVHKVEWAKYLNKTISAPKTKRSIIQASNRFTGWLHEQKPDIPKLVFAPISKAKFDTLTATYDSNPDVRKRNMIPDEHWKKIKKNLPAEIAPFVHLCYNYGLRRSESLAVEKRDIKKGHLSAERQITTIDTSEKNYQYKTKILKGKTSRKIPHWFCNPEAAYEWATLAASLRMHPDTFGKKWAELMKALGYQYTLHEVRHTFVTKAIRLYAPRDVQLAAGHKNIATTMHYSHDDREMSDEEFKPDEDVA